MPQLYLSLNIFFYTERTLYYDKETDKYFTIIQTEWIPSLPDPNKVNDTLSSKSWNVWN